MALPQPKASFQRLFNRLSPSYARFVFSQLRAETRAHVAWLQPRANERVLDLACGPGTLAVELARYGCSVYALDLAEGMITVAQVAARQRRLRAIYFAVADAEQLPLPGGRFDLVTCAFSFPVFPTARKALDEICRVTRPRGRIALVEVVVAEDPAEREAWDRLERLRSGGIPTRLLSLADLLGLSRQAGLSLADAHVFERSRRLEDWLCGAVVEGGPSARRRLRQEFLESARAHSSSFHLEQHHGHWFYSAKVARLLWRK
ncbi:MAG TPA: methyltransferase domain-containing protein [Candidatus Acidoferrales bacterium]|nr:methyltransferase domain-containing protein [Candidatus Acidoferrales bacterium]